MRVHGGALDSDTIFHRILAWHLTCCPMHFDDQRPTWARRASPVSAARIPEMRSVPRLVFAALVGMALLMPPVVRAQSSAIPAQQTAPGWVFTPSISYGGTWDDNVLLANPGSNPPADYGMPITPAASIDYTGRSTRFSSGYSGAFLRYMTLEELNSLQQSFRASVDRRVSNRVTLIGQESYTAAPTTDVLQLSGVPFYRIGSRTNAATGGVQIALAKHTMLRSNYRLNTVDFDTSPLTDNQLQGGHTHEIITTVDQALSRHFTVGGEYDFSRNIVNGEISLTGPTPQDRFNMQTVMGTAQYQVAAGTMLSGGVGLAMMGAGLTHEARTGPEWRVALSQKMSRGAIATGYSRSYIPSFGFGGTFQNQEWDTNVHTPLGHTRAYVAGAFTWMNNESLDNSQPSLRTAWLAGTVGYYLTRWLSLEGFYERTQQNSQRAGGQLERDQAGFRVVATKPMRIR
jgi:hypothetical protein